MKFSGVFSNQFPSTGGDAYSYMTPMGQVALDYNKPIERQVDNNGCVSFARVAVGTTVVRRKAKAVPKKWVG